MRGGTHSILTYSMPVLSTGLHNMRQPGSLALFSPGTFISKDAKNAWWTTEKNVKCLGKCGSKWHFLPGTFFENIKCAWEHADAKNTSSPGTFYGHFESAWDSADVKKFFCQAILLKIFKAPGIVWMQQTLFFQALFYGNIESTWDSADATNPSFPGTSYGKSAGENAEAKNTFLSGTLLRY